MQIERQECFRYVNDVGIRPQPRITRNFLIILKNISDVTYLFSRLCGSLLSRLLSSQADDAGNASREWAMETLESPFNTPAGSK